MLRRHFTKLFPAAALLPSVALASTSGVPCVRELNLPVDHGSFIYDIEASTQTRWLVYASNFIDPSREVPGFYDDDGWLQARAETLEYIRRHVHAMDSTAVELRVQCTDGVALTFVAEAELFDLIFGIYSLDFSPKMPHPLAPNLNAPALRPSSAT